ncbi:hypothetical protein C8J57DRAFT_1248210 [Mycena rebaudengoi]|nr:hypothetical protein C8J57DRAFT_1248210 [Mycena rebaudengoi]
MDGYAMTEGKHYAIFLNALTNTIRTTSLVVSNLRIRTGRKIPVAQQWDQGHSRETQLQAETLTFWVILRKPRPKIIEKPPSTFGIRIDPVRPPTRSNLGRICQAGPSNPNYPSSGEEWTDAMAGTYQLSFTVTAAFITSTLSGPVLGRSVVGAPLQLAPEIQICSTLPWTRNSQGTGAVKIKNTQR